jgi:hypothetical protein
VTGPAEPLRKGGPADSRPPPRLPLTRSAIISAPSGRRVAQKSSSRILGSKPETPCHSRSAVSSANCLNHRNRHSLALKADNPVLQRPYGIALTLEVTRWRLCIRLWRSVCSLVVGDQQPIQDVAQPLGRALFGGCRILKETQEIAHRIEHGVDYSRRRLRRPPLRPRLRRGDRSGRGAV